MDNHKRSPRRLLKGIMFLIVCGAVMALVIYSPIFVLREVRVQGTTYLSTDDICHIAKIYYGEPLFKLQTDEITKNLLRDLRIEEATVRRSLPFSLDMQIKERLPVATVACEYGYLDLDARGKVIDSYRTLKNMPIPMITGVTMHDMYIGDDNQDKTVAGILFFLEQLDAASLNQISEISIAETDNIVAYTNGSIQIKLGSLERLEEKARLTRTFLLDMNGTQHPVEYADFRFTSPVIKLRQAGQP